MTTKTGSHPQETSQPHDGRPGKSDLDRRYGDIGIMAVAAALRYAGIGKKPARAPVMPRLDERFQERTA